jgi:hypothetical protein
MSDEKYQKVIEQIKKLFALSKSPNENEAALAMEKAREMMFKHNIEEADLASGQTEDVIEVDFDLASRYHTPDCFLAIWIGKAFMIRPLIIKNRVGLHKIDTKMRFIGGKSDVAAGTYVYSYILNLVEAKSEEYFQKIRYSKSKWTPAAAKKARADFGMGFVDAVNIKLKKMEEDRIANQPKYEAEVYNALVVVKDALIQKHMEDKYNNTSKMKVQTRYNDKHYGAGFEQGEKTGIHKGVESGKTAQAQIGV